MSYVERCYSYYPEINKIQDPGICSRVIVDCIEFFRKKHLLKRCDSVEIDVFLSKVEYSKLIKNKNLDYLFSVCGLHSHSSLKKGQWRVEIRRFGVNTNYFMGEDLCQL